MDGWTWEFGKSGVWQYSAFQILKLGVWTWEFGKSGVWQYYCHTPIDQYTDHMTPLSSNASSLGKDADTVCGWRDVPLRYCTVHCTVQYTIETVRVHYTIEMCPSVRWAWRRPGWLGWPSGNGLDCIATIRYWTGLYSDHQVMDWIV